jgi:hypothetical protein
MSRAQRENVDVHEVRTIAELLNQIRRNEILLPEFQRGYVWNSDQVRGLMQSLYRKHPTGHLLIWRTYKPSPVRGGQAPPDGHSLLLLDGQQRLTSLYVIFEGKAPPFYEGEALFPNLYFNMQTEEFRFWQKSIMEGSAAWISVHDFLRKGLDGVLEGLDALPAEHRETYQKNLARLGRLHRIREYSYTVDQLSGDEYSVDEVVDIFNRVNKAGTPLTKADLALAHICTIWPEARDELRRFSASMKTHGFGVDMTFLVRSVAAVAAGSVLLEGPFFRVEAEDLQRAWRSVRSAFEHLVNVLRHEAFIDDLDTLPTIYVLLPMTVYLARRDCIFPSEAIRRRFIRWMYLAGLWARYSGATETKLQQDVVMVSGRDRDPTHELEAAIVRERGRLTIEAADLAGASLQSAYASFSYVVARAREARDWFSGIRLYDKAIGKSNGLESHHIFSRAVLKRAGYSASEDKKVINEMANRAYLTQKANRSINKTPPDEYLPEVEANQPGALRAQSVPMDRALWKPDRYSDFLAARRQLLAQAMNEYLATWIADQQGEEVDESAVRKRISAGESDRLEFKSSLRWDRKENRVNKELERVVIKTVAGLLNAKKGGDLLIGVSDSGEIAGLEDDYASLMKKDRDGFELHLRHLLSRDLGDAISPFLTVTFHELDGHDVCQVSVEPCDHPVYLTEAQTATFFLRVGNGTNPLPVKEAVRYVQTRWGGTS